MFIPDVSIISKCGQLTTDVRDEPRYAFRVDLNCQRFALSICLWKDPGALQTKLHFVS